VLAACAAALAVRLLAIALFQGLAAPPDRHAQPDQIDYEATGWELASGHGFAIAGQPSWFRPPGTSFLIAAVYLVAGRSWAALRIVFALLSALTCAVLALPYAYFLVRVASRRLRLALLVASVLPLWVSYLVRVYSWRLILNPDGALNWALNGLGLPDQNIAYTNWAMWLVFTYIWFPFMVLPVYAALERVPYSYVEASADLGAKGWTTLRRVILPLAVPGLAAGSIFTFSLTLGDYIAPSLVGGPGSSLIGTVVFENLGLANNLPFAAAFATIPLAIMAVYLALMKRLGAFESL